MRLAIELISTAALILAVGLATGLVWPALVAFAASGFYFAYIWEFEAVKRPNWWRRVKKDGSEPVRK
jgi:hypothetical protein